VNLQGDSEDELKTMSFGDHLEELRTRLFRSILVTLVFAVVAFIFQDSLMSLITVPHRTAMSQVTARQQIAKIEGKISGVNAELQQVDDSLARRLLEISASDEEWWSRWEQFRQSQEQSPVVGRMALLLEERLIALDPDRSSMRVLGVTPENLLKCADQLKLTLGDLPWGGKKSVENCITGLEQAASRWNQWTLDPAADEAASDETTSDATVGEPAEDVETAADVVETAQVDAETRSILEGVAAASVTLLDETALLLGWREQAKPLALLSYSEAFFSYLKLSLMLGILISLPWITFEMWNFIAAGLFDQERRAVRPFLPMAFLLLAMGVSFAYLVLVPVGLSFLGGYGDPALVQATFTLKEYLGLVFTLILGMGVLFQLPLMMIFLSRSGLVEIQTFRTYRKYAIMGAVLLGAMLTPPDVVTQLLMAGPLTVLYELGILACVMFGGSKVSHDEG